MSTETANRLSGQQTGGNGNTPTSQQIAALTSAMPEVSLGLLAGILPPGFSEQVTKALHERQMAMTTLDKSSDARTIVLPKNMTEEDAVEWLQNKIKADNQTVEVAETIEAFPFDAAHAVTVVLKEDYGFVGSYKQILHHPFWGEMEFDPKFITIALKNNKKTQVPWGTFQIPGIEGKLTCATTNIGNRVVFQLRGSIKAKFKERFQEFAARIREVLVDGSIYKGQALRIEFSEGGKPIFFDPSKVPEFMDLKGSERPIFNKTTEAHIETSILTPIRHIDRLRKNKLKFRRNVLLCGGFGTGKTLTAKQVARECVEHEITFIYVPNCSDLAAAMQLAKQYAPCVVFTEDAERTLGGVRDERLDALSYQIDGIDTKSDETLVIMSTNNPEKISDIMLRPGRTDDVILIEDPDVDTCYRIMQHYAGDILKGTRDEFLDAMGLIKGRTAAFIREVISKAQLNAMSHSDTFQITPNDVKLAAERLQNHMDLMDKDKVPPQTVVPLSSLTVVAQDAVAMANTSAKQRDDLITEIALKTKELIGM